MFEKELSKQTDEVDLLKSENTSVKSSAEHFKAKFEEVLEELSLAKKHTEEQEKKI